MRATKCPNCRRYFRYAPPQVCPNCGSNCKPANIGTLIEDRLIAGDTYEGLIENGFAHASIYRAQARLRQRLSADKDTLRSLSADYESVGI